MKKMFLLLLALLLIFGVLYVTNAQSETIDAKLNKQIKVTFNGDYQEFQNVKGEKVFPISYEGTTYLPIRSISSLFNSKIKWDGNTNSIYLGEGDLDTNSSKKVSSPFIGSTESIKATLNKDIKIYFNSKVQSFTDANGKSVFPISYKGTTYLPVRAVSNLFNLKIDWDGNTNVVVITNDDEEKKAQSKESNNLANNTIKIEVNNKELVVELENNQATKELVQKLNSGNVVVNASEYGGFEKVGSLGFSLTRDDKQIKTEAGDIVLYQGNQISLFYNSNSWSYTKLGKVTNMSANELKTLLGNGDVTLTIKK